MNSCKRCLVHITTRVRTDSNHSVLAKYLETVRDARETQLLSSPNRKAYSMRYPGYSFNGMLLFHVPCLIALSRRVKLAKKGPFGEIKKIELKFTPMKDQVT